MAIANDCINTMDASKTDLDILSVRAPYRKPLPFNCRCFLACWLSLYRLFYLWNEQRMWLISILYPILDTIALIPCLLIVASFRGRSNESAYSIEWLLLSCSIIIVTIAEIVFGYSEVLGRSEEEQWFWDTMYAASYIVMAGALFTIVYSRHINAKPLKYTIH
jgi:hypothetical protein